MMFKKRKFKEWTSLPANFKPYTIVIRSNGKRRVYRTEAYMLIRRLKFAGAIIAAIAVMLLMCGMAAIEGKAVMPVQMIFFAGVGLFTLISLICSFVSYKEPWENQGNNKKSTFRRKSK